MIIVVLVIVILYASLILWLVYGFGKVSSFDPISASPKVSFSIVVPFRNEAGNLPKLLQSLSHLLYPKELFEVILVDDHSEDEGTTIISTFGKEHPDLNLIIIQNERTSKSPKKDAIETAISIAKHPWILTTDADCKVPATWLSVFNDFILENDPKMVVAPVNYSARATFLEQFQLLDFYSLIGATIGSFGVYKPLMANGANLAYKKEAFLKVNGFRGNEHIASGDDIFLLEKFLAAFPKELHFLKSDKATVQTLPETNWRSVWNQRIRWAAKASGYKNIFTKLVGIIVLLINLLIVVGWTLLPLGKFDINVLLLPLLLKLFVDSALLIKTLKLFKQRASIFYFILSHLLYPFFSTLVAIFSIFFGYKWKGRSFKQ